MKKRERKETWSQFLKQLLYYHTAKVVQIRSWKLGLLNYFVIVVILFYVGFWAIYWNKGYQSTGNLVGNTSIKVKGNAYIYNQTENLPLEIWDAENAVYPPKEPDALFVTTNVLETPKQKRDVCTEIPDSEDEVKCQEDSDCKNLTSTTHGINTGECDKTNNQCKIYAWCPVENEGEIPSRLLVGVEEFTVFVRVTVKFPKYGVSRDNANGTVPTPLYNLFTIEEMVQNSKSDWKDISTFGGVIAVQIHWDCNFDLSYDKCQPEFTFTRIDNSKTEKLSRGYNFRYAHYYYLQSDSPADYVEHRDLFKVYGTRFVFLLSGKAAKFDPIPLLINIGSGLALLSVATIISDFITLFLLPDRKFYKTVKYETIDDKLEKKKVVKTNDKNVQEEFHENQNEETPLLDSVEFKI